MADHIVSAGGGIASTLLLPLDVVANHGAEHTQIVMAVLPNEHPDNWRLADRAEELTGVPVTYIAYDADSPKRYRVVDKADRANRELLKTPIDVFLEVHFLGNTRADPCSRILKRQTVAAWVTDHYLPGECIIYVGIGADEIERFMGVRDGWGAAGYETRFPLMDWREMDRRRAVEACRLLNWNASGGWVPALYTKADIKDPTTWAFAHNNCGGACVKAGHRQWLNLLVHFPEIYLEWEDGEEQFRALHGDYSILRDRRGGKVRTLTLRELRKRFEKELARSNGKISSLRIWKWAEDTPGCVACEAAIPEFAPLKA